MGRKSDESSRSCGKSILLGESPWSAASAAVAMCPFALSRPFFMGKPGQNGTLIERHPRQYGARFRIVVAYLIA